MPDTPPTATVAGQSIALHVTGYPYVPNRWGPGHIRVTGIRLDYGSTRTPDARHAFITGLWVRDDGEHTDAPVDRYYDAHDGDTSTWPDWLAGLTRKHDPAVSPPAAARAGVLREEAALIRAHCPDHLDSNSADGSWINCHCDVADDMERRADETQQPEPHSCRNCEGIDPNTCLTNPDRAAASAVPGRSAATSSDEEACGPAPDRCDAESGESCANHERQQAHAEGEHCFCGDECEGAK